MSDKPNNIQVAAGTYSHLAMPANGGAYTREQDGTLKLVEETTAPRLPKSADAATVQPGNRKATKG